jgi:hypothetical protein
VPAYGFGSSHGSSYGYGSSHGYAPQKRSADPDPGFYGGYYYGHPHYGYGGYGYGGYGYGHGGYYGHFLGKRSTGEPQAVKSEAPEKSTDSGLGSGFDSSSDIAFPDGDFASGADVEGLPEFSISDMIGGQTRVQRSAEPFFGLFGGHHYGYGYGYPSYLYHGYGHHHHHYGKRSAEPGFGYGYGLYGPGYGHHHGHLYGYGLGYGHGYGYSYFG